MNTSLKIISTANLKLFKISNPVIISFTAKHDEVIMQHLKTISITTNQLPFSMRNEIKQGGYIRSDQMMLRIQEERVSMSILTLLLKVSTTSTTQWQQALRL